MSLAALKNTIRDVFFQETEVSQKNNQTQPLLRSRVSESQISNADSDTTDVEAQESSLEKWQESKNSRKSKIIADSTLGLSDGLTVPFALTAGLSTLGNTRVVIYGGMAELIAGAISMGLGAYLSAKSEVDSYNSELEQAKRQMKHTANRKFVLTDLRNVFGKVGLSRGLIDEINQHFDQASCEDLAEVFMRFGQCKDEPDARTAIRSGFTVGMAYLIGGLLPLLPYFFVNKIHTGLYISIAVMVVALFSFGYGKTGVTDGWTGHDNISKACKRGVEMVVVGVFSAGSAMALVHYFSKEQGGLAS